MVDSNCIAMVDKGYASGEVKGNDSCTAIKKQALDMKKKMTSATNLINLVVCNFIRNAPMLCNINIPFFL